MAPLKDSFRNILPRGLGSLQVSMRTAIGRGGFRNIITQSLGSLQISMSLVSLRTAATAISVVIGPHKPGSVASSFVSLSSGAIRPFQK